MGQPISVTTDIKMVSNKPTRFVQRSLIGINEASNISLSNLATIFQFSPAIMLTLISAPICFWEQPTHKLNLCTSDTVQLQFQKSVVITWIFDE